MKGFDYKYFYFFILSLIFLTIFSCNPSISRIGYDLNDKQIKQGCEVYIVKDSSLIFSEQEKLGEIKIGDTGFSSNCGSAKVAKILENEACNIGANIISIKNIKPPSFWSSCYRVRAVLIKSDLDSVAIMNLIKNSVYNLEDKDKYFEGVHIDSLEVPIPKFRASVGLEMSTPSGFALNTYMYIYGFGLNYSYGFPSSTSDPEKSVRDVNNSHHLKISFALLSLQNPITFNPIYIGYGKSYLNEKSVVQGFEGKGKIQATHYFIGLRLGGAPSSPSCARPSGRTRGTRRAPPA